jgi:hypothetical protein
MWQFNIDSISVEKKTIITKTESRICFGELIRGSFDDVAHLYQHIPGSEKLEENGGIWTCNSIFCFVWRNILILSIPDPCEATIPLISVDIGGESFPIEPEILMLETLENSETMCVGSIIGYNQMGWSFGERFLWKVYTVYDQKKQEVSFGHIKKGRWFGK